MYLTWSAKTCIFGYVSKQIVNKDSGDNLKGCLGRCHGNTGLPGPESSTYNNSHIPGYTAALNNTCNLSFAIDNARDSYHLFPKLIIWTQLLSSLTGCPWRRGLRHCWLQLLSDPQGAERTDGEFSSEFYTFTEIFRPYVTGYQIYGIDLCNIAYEPFLDIYIAANMLMCLCHSHSLRLMSDAQDTLTQSINIWRQHHCRCCFCPCWSRRGCGRSGAAVFYE